MNDSTRFNFPLPKALKDAATELAVDQGESLATFIRQAMIAKLKSEGRSWGARPLDHAEVPR